MVFLSNAPIYSEEVSLIALRIPSVTFEDSKSRASITEDNMGIIGSV